MTETRQLTARDIGYALCHSCHLLNPYTDRPLPKGYKLICCRCGAPLKFRKTRSVGRTWALLVASMILLAPANYYTVMTVVELGYAQPDTIISGTLRLYHSGFVLIAVLIFIASVLVPFFKITGLMYLLYSVQRGKVRRVAHRILVYRIVRVIGRWSMLDMFVMSILLAMVQFGKLANVEPGPAATYFTLVVVLTMFAAETFDPRLMWMEQPERGVENE